ncbi:hypothetical protein Sulku_1332 [Sulfuricurvum kujiense DSM 16994]|uniref:Uncharacterized protein n=1 Tax=Sulfuricurvum kujiense (strain ATCC BAA-921 / DSM 16994 / JCM 11577 / YK-1) TaxID=709032 RepID=E4TY75_SULKY|nr:hypothetical protein Sulku_1332 [Sulfuricurvum kujiense DSM 16994]
MSLSRKKYLHTEIFVYILFLLEGKFFVLTAIMHLFLFHPTLKKSNYLN